ncbi:MAG: phosphomethylpyrimidine kinase [Candidatus Coatesbacteria bacterium]|nr:MAG: phosphomethylpyrimidine kinase [Candidatus Coatesbacteria bacterium]RLC43623.1 MAG: phosphomethylpyrimidine kinase [Candidatus Coatesbacteria bacterium]HEC79948.1 phosphomethylpyrimidine kinase [Bacillota bacterium]
MIEIEDFELYAKMYKAMEHLENCREFATLIPEVRSNLVYAKKGAKTPDDVLAIDGRITVVNNIPHASGRIRFGASSHMARLIIEVMKREPSIRAGINFIYSPEIVRLLKRYASKNGWVVCPIDRTDEPDEIKDVEGASARWKVDKAFEITEGKLPKIIFEFGGVGKEDLSYIIGEDPIRVVKDMCDIAQRYIQTLKI